MSQLIILNQSLSDTEFHQTLAMKKYKIKGLNTIQFLFFYSELFFLVSTGTLRDTLIFPQSTAAFMVLPANDSLTKQNKITPELKIRLQKFDQLHHKCYIVLYSALINSKLLSLLQEELLCTSLSFLPSHSPSESIESIMTIATVMSKPLSEVISERFQSLKTRLCSENSVLLVLSQLGVEQRDALILLDSCGGLAGVVMETRQGNLNEYNLSPRLVTKIEELLS